MTPTLTKDPRGHRRSTSVRALVLSTCLLAPVAHLSGQGRAELREAQKSLDLAVRSTDTRLFAEAAAVLLAAGSSREVKEVVESYGSFIDRGKDLGQELFYRFHADVAKLVGRTGAKGADEELRRLLERGRVWGTRLLALDVAALRAGIDTLAAARTALADKDPRIVRRSLDYLRNIESGTREFAARLQVVDLIVERFLEIDDDKAFRGPDWDRARLACRAALTRIIKVGLPSALDYQSFLSVRRSDPGLFDAPDPDAGGRTQLTLFGAEISGKNIVFLLDVSGSMLATDPIKLTGGPSGGGTVVAGSDAEKKLIEERINSRRRITRAQGELAKVVRALPDGIRFNIIAYSSDLLPWKKELTRVDDAARKSAMKFIDELAAAGVTATDTALEAAMAELDVDTIYLITDGAPTHVGSAGSARPVDAEDIIRSIHARMKVLNFLRGVRIFTLGFPEAEEEFLVKLADDHSGKYAAID